MITDAKIVTVKVKIKGEDENDKQSFDVYMVKMKGAWKVLDYKNNG